MSLADITSGHNACAQISKQPSWNVRCCIRMKALQRIGETAHLIEKDILSFLLGAQCLQINNWGNLSVPITVLCTASLLVFALPPLRFSNQVSIVSALLDYHSSCIVQPARFSKQALARPQSQE